MHTLKILVAIASFGDKNLHLLRDVIARYRAMRFDVDIIVFSNAPKDLGPEVEVKVGLPSRNPWSLPFAHKSAFVEKASDYDIFVYSEDDMGLTQRNLEAFLALEPHLAGDEIAGFMRYEVDAAGCRYLLDVHGRFHWVPGSARKRGPHTIAEFTNEHAALYVLTKTQLAAVIASGQFDRPPYEGRYDMLCTAATDVYTVCGFRKVLCISALDDFLVHHTSNRYAGKWGIPVSEIGIQTDIQSEIVEGKVGPPSILLGNETRMLHGEWSKSYYETPVENILKKVPESARTVLSVGCGDGAPEAELAQRGARVTAVPIDSIIGATASSRGLETVDGSLDESYGKLRDRRFDCLMMTNILHLLPNPTELIATWIKLLRPGGVCVVSGPNFESLRVRVKRVVGASEYQRLQSYEESGVNPIGPAAIEAQLKKIGVKKVGVEWFGGSSGVERKMGRYGAAQWVLIARAGTA